MQELGSAVVFRHVISKNKNFKNAKEIAADKKLYGELLKIWQEYGLDVVDMSWLESFYKQQSALISEISKPTVLNTIVRMVLWITSQKLLENNLKLVKKITGILLISG